jgi:hypothetical protein
MVPCIVGDSVEIPTRCSFVIEFIIPKFIEGSTCFERQTTHQQELETLFASSGLYTNVVTGCCLGNGWSPYGYIFNYKQQMQNCAYEKKKKKLTQATQ